MDTSVDTKGDHDDTLTVRAESKNSYNVHINLEKNNDDLQTRANLAQWLATLANSMMFLGVGMMVGVSTVVNGVLHNNTDGQLSLNDDQASWFGSLMLLVQPIGCVISGFLQQFIGRKAGMILMNIPELIAWALLYKGTSVEALYLSMVMMGMSAGFMEAPGLSYIGEISEPRIRGILTSYANINVSVGLLIEFFLGSVFHWRTAVCISGVFPLISIVMISLVPDSPVWLLNKGRREEALRALCWLRGWVSEDKVKVEFEELCKYIEASKLPKIKKSRSNIYIEVPTKGYLNARGTGIIKPVQRNVTTWKMKISDAFRPSMLRPFRLVIGYQLFFHFAALSGVRSYMIEAFSSLGMPVQPQWVAFTSGAVMLIGGTLCILTVRRIGKRRLSLISMFFCALACLLLGVYAQYKTQINLPWVPLTLFCSLYFMTMIGIGPIPWMLISEVFPVRGRSFGAGISAASFYIIAFVFSKTYLDLLHLVGLEGCFYVYGLGGVVGFIFLYTYLPETEGKTLAEVERCFDSKKCVIKINAETVAV